jgi:hypothetical protein
MMTAKEKVVIRILLLVATLASPSEWANEVKNLANHINQEKFEVK